jgi:hypothetical protein
MDPVLKRIKILTTPRNTIDTIMIPTPERDPSSLVVELLVRLPQNSFHELKFTAPLFAVVLVAAAGVVDVLVPAGPVAPVADILAYSLIR